MVNQLKVRELSEQLLNLGYHQPQVQSIVQETVGTDQLDELTEDDGQRLLEVLEWYVGFARKCWKG